MTFLVTLIALLIERFFDWGHVRRWQWYEGYQNVVAKRFLGKASYLILVLTVIPLVLLVAIIEFALNDWLYGFARLLFELVTLLYCLGPKDLWADTFACLNALTQTDTDAASEKLTTSFGNGHIMDSSSLRPNLLNHIFIEANRRIFAVIFWFVLLGPAGAFLYRAIACSASHMTKEEAGLDLTQSARKIESLLDWVPARILTFIFALGGHFAKVLVCWRKNAVLGPESNETLLTECGKAALGSDEDGNRGEDGSVEKSAISLLDRSFVIVLVLVAVLVLVI